MNVKGRYLKDESGNIFSPITNMETVYASDVGGQIKDYFVYGMHRTMYEGSTSAWRTSYQLEGDVAYTLFFVLCYVLYNRDSNQITDITGAAVVPYSSNTLPIKCDWCYNGQQYYVYDAFTINQNSFTLNWQSNRHLSNAGGYDGGLLIYKVYGFLDYGKIWSYL